MSVLVNGRSLTTFNFPGGECHVRVPIGEVAAVTQVQANLGSSDDIMTLLMTVDALRRVNANAAIHLNIPYFPYARQDRVCNPGEALSVRVMADLINSLHCEQVTICDPHSDVTSALLNRCVVKTLADLVSQSLLCEFMVENNLTLISPDAGAEKKVYQLVRILADQSRALPWLRASKVRDSSTGRLLSVEIYGDVAGKNCMILDDLCDGGQTFIQLAQQMKQQGANDIYLYVTHGVFSRGLAPLKEYFKRVFCYHLLKKSDLSLDSFLVQLS